MMTLLSRIAASLRAAVGGFLDALRLNGEVTRRQVRRHFG